MATQDSLGVHSEVGQLRKVMVCAPGRAHQRLTPSNCDGLLFDDVLWVEVAKRDHFDFMQKLRDRGVDVWSDQYPYPTSGTDGSTVLIPACATRAPGSTGAPAPGSRAQMLTRVLGDPSTETQVRAAGEFASSAWDTSLAIDPGHTAAPGEKRVANPGCCPRA